jgi:hypothetical protein
VQTARVVFSTDKTVPISFEFHLVLLTPAPSRQASPLPIGGEGWGEGVQIVDLIFWVSYSFE